MLSLVINTFDIFLAFGRLLTFQILPEALKLFIMAGIGVSPSC